MVALAPMVQEPGFPPGAEAPDIPTHQSIDESGERGDDEERQHHDHHE